MLGLPSDSRNAARDVESRVTTNVSSATTGLMPPSSSAGPTDELSETETAHPATRTPARSRTTNRTGMAATRTISTVRLKFLLCLGWFSGWRSGEGCGGMCWAGGGMGCRPMRWVTFREGNECRRITELWAFLRNLSRVGTGYPAPKPDLLESIVCSHRRSSQPWR